MATIAATIVQVPSLTGVKMYKWAALATGDVGALVDVADYSDMTVQFNGTFAGGSSASLMGTNDSAVTPIVLTDPQGNAITKTAAAIEAVTEAVRYMRPQVLSGAADAVDVYLLCRRGSR